MKLAVSKASKMPWAHARCSTVGDPGIDAKKCVVNCGRPPQSTALAITVPANAASAVDPPASAGSEPNAACKHEPVAASNPRSLIIRSNVADRCCESTVRGGVVGGAGAV